MSNRQTVSLSPEVLKELRELAEETMIPISRLVEAALKQYLAARKEA